MKTIEKRVGICYFEFIVSVSLETLVFVAVKIL